jgi:hypothetical protein
MGIGPFRAGKSRLSRRFAGPTKSKVLAFSSPGGEFNEQTHLQFGRGSNLSDVTLLRTRSER